MVTLLPPTSTDSGSNPELVGGLRYDDRNLTPRIFLRVLLFSLPQQNGLPAYSIWLWCCAPRSRRVFTYFMFSCLMSGRVECFPDCISNRKHQSCQAVSGTWFREMFVWQGNLHDNNLIDIGSPWLDRSTSLYLWNGIFTDRVIFRLISPWNCGRRGGIMVSAPCGGGGGGGGRRFRPWPGTLCRVLGQDTLLSRCLSPPRCINGYRRI